MPSRIVVGYLPGTTNGDVVDEQPVYSVSSQLLHAWPEVYFDGLGWIPFEPTAGLGVPTAFSAGRIGAGRSDTGRDPRGDSRSPPARGALDPNDPNDPRDDQASGPTIGTVNPLPGSASCSASCFCSRCPPSLAASAAGSWLRRHAGGDAASAWTIVQDAAIDLAIPVPASETPRAFAYRLVDEFGVPPDEMNGLLIAIETRELCADAIARLPRVGGCDGCRVRRARVADEQCAAGAPHPRPGRASLAHRASRKRLRRQCCEGESAVAGTFNPRSPAR